MVGSGALVVGSSGFIGSRLVKRLMTDGQYAFVRGVDRVPPRSYFAGAQFHAHDVRDPLPVALAEGVGVIFNLAAVHMTPGHEPHDYYDTNVAGAINVANLATAAGVERLVFTSSISVYGPSEDVLTEASPPQPVSDYGRSKLFAEHIHQQWLAGAPSRRLVIVRPGVIFGPGEGGNYTTLIRALKKRIFFYPGRRDATKSGGFVDDLISAMQFALARDDRQILFNYAFPELKTTEEIVSAVGDVLGIGIRPATIPLPVLLASALGFEILNALGLKNRIHRDRVRKLVHSTKVYPEWLVSKGYPFTSDLEGALRAWAAETAGRFD